MPGWLATPFQDIAVEVVVLSAIRYNVHYSFRLGSD